MMKLGKISPLAFSRMKQRGISIDVLNHLLTHGQVEKQFDGAQVVYLDSPTPSPTWGGNPKPRLYAVLDAAGDVLTVENRVRLRACAALPLITDSLETCNLFLWKRTNIGAVK